MKSAKEWNNDLSDFTSCDAIGCECTSACDEREIMIRAIQADALKTVSTGIISMMGAPPWLEHRAMGDEIIKRISEIIPKGPSE